MKRPGAVVAPSPDTCTNLNGRPAGWAEGVGGQRPRGRDGVVARDGDVFRGWHLGLGDAEGPDDGFGVGEGGEEGGRRVGEEGGVGDDVDFEA